MVMQHISRSLALPSVVGCGRSGLAFGCMGITAFYGEPMNTDEAVALLKTVYNLGCRHFDTAEIYKTGDPASHGSGDIYNEAVVSNFLKTVPRDSFTVATKYMPQRHEGRCDYVSVRDALGKSLERLGLEYVDLYYCHRITTLEGALEFANAAQKLKKEGLIKAVGLSEIGPQWLQEVHKAAGPIDAIQQEWSLLTRNLEKELVPTCRDLGIAIVAYSPLARALLASKDTLPSSDWRSQRMPRFQGDNFKKNQVHISDVVADIADKYDCTPAQLSLAWLFKKAQQLGVAVVPIPGTTSAKHALANAASTTVDIDDESMKVLDGLAERIVGARGDESYVNLAFESKGCA